jgi:hypothetical protein
MRGKMAKEEQQESSLLNNTGIAPTIPEGAESHDWCKCEQKHYDKTNCICIRCGKKVDTRMPVDLFRRLTPDEYAHVFEREASGETESLGKRCTCTGTCRGESGLGSGWYCALKEAPQAKAQSVIPEGAEGRDA